MSLLSDLLAQATSNASLALNCACPAVVQSYDYSKQKAVVKPAIRHLYLDGSIVEPPVISAVPVVFPRAGGASLTMPVKAGDTVLLIYSDRAIESWLSQGGVSTPADIRTHSMTDAIAIPGVIPFVTGSLAENNDDVLLTYSDSKVRLKPGGIVQIESSSKVQIDTPQAEVNCDAATITATATVTHDTPTTLLTGNLVVTKALTVLNTGGGSAGTINGDLIVTSGDVIADTISLKHHTHSGVQPGGGDTGEPNP